LKVIPKAAQRFFVFGKFASFSSAEIGRRFRSK
jgi:hypothetical protein